MKYRNALPQLAGDLFLTDGGIETTLIYLHGLELPYFAAFDLLKDAAGRASLRKYYRGYCAVARRFGTGLILESATWRASPDWASKLGYRAEAQARVNREAIGLLEEVRAEGETGATKIVISGCVGPRGDGYQPRDRMLEDEAEDYHRPQIAALAAAGADMICAMTMNYVEEAIGIACAAMKVQMPVALSFTVETDGRLPTGDSLRTAIECVDAVTDSYPQYYMINCAHPSHFSHVLSEETGWVERIRGLRCNASSKSHTELNESVELDTGNPDALACDYAELTRRFPRMNVLGGCCGTDERHVAAIASACAASEPSGPALSARAAL
jgi:S-methylmethionine-dependent homocysteine/selenocysteine methylase